MAEPSETGTLAHDRDIAGVYALSGDLRQSVDRNTGELAVVRDTVGAHSADLAAIRATQQEHSQALAEMQSMLAEVAGILRRLEAR
jgi:hypothetical protein